MGNVGGLVPAATGEEVGLDVPAIVVAVGIPDGIFDGTSVLVTLVTEDDGLEVGRTVPTWIGLGVPTTGDSVVGDTVGDVVAVSGTGGGVGCCGS